MAITRLKHHDNHKVYVQLERYKQIGHYASLHCAECNIWIQWLNKWDTESIQALGVPVRPRKLLQAADLGV